MTILPPILKDPVDTESVRRSLLDLMDQTQAALDALDALISSMGGLALGETSTTAYRGDRGKTAYDHSLIVGNPHGATQDDIGDGTTYKQYSQTEKTKLAGIAAGANAYVHPNHSGEVTSAGDGAQTIATAAVTLAKMANLAQNTIIGRIAAGAGVPEALSAANVRTIINVADGATANVGTVTGVTGTAPVVSSGGAAPAISMAAATSAVNGYATSTQISKLDGIEAAADVTDAANVGAVNAAASAKNPPIDADSFIIVDSAGANAIKRVTGTVLKAYIGSTIAAHATSHKNGGTDEVATATAAANAIPKATAAGKLDSWISDSSSSVKGLNTLSTIAEVTTGTETKTVTPASLRTSVPLLNGVAFPGTQVASADANTLDDYEEGTWTPTLIGSSVAGTQTYTNQRGYYTKIGRLVHLHCYVSISAKGGTMAGDARIGGLPFTISNATGYAGVGGAIAYADNITFSASCLQLFVNGIVNTTTMKLSQFRTGSTSLDLPVSGLGAATAIVFDAMYMV